MDTSVLIALITLIVTVMTLLVMVISLMFPNVFPAIGNFLKGIKWYIWIISFLTIIILGQTYLIVFKWGLL